MTRPIRDLLETVRDHLTVFGLPEPFSVRVDSYASSKREHVAVHVLAPGTVSGVASALIVWSETLSHVVASIWLPSASSSVHLQLDGFLTDGTSAEVWGSARQEPGRVAWEPGAKTSVPLGVLREWAEVHHDH